MKEAAIHLPEENIERHGLNNMSAEVWDATVFDADSAGKETADTTNPRLMILSAVIPVFIQARVPGMNKGLFLA